MTSPITEKFFPEAGAGGFTRIDGKIEFYKRVNALLRPDMTVLDFGAGRGKSITDDPIPYRRELSRLRGKVSHVIGADPDPVVRSNPGIDEAVVFELRPDGSLGLPIGDEAVDLILSDYTFEHVTNPGAVAREFDRTLKPGGWICARIPNKWGCIGIGNRIVPESWKSALLKRLRPHRREEDVFPTAYRMNMIGDNANFFSLNNYNSYSYTINSESAYFGNPSIMIIINKILPELWGSMMLIFIKKSMPSADVSAS